METQNKQSRALLQNHINKRKKKKSENHLW